MTGWIRCFILVSLLMIWARAAAENGRVEKNTTTKEQTTTDCEVNGVTLRHRSMKYYGENSYVACANGKAGCYLVERVHDKATQVACPTQDFQQRIDEESAYRAHQANVKAKESGDKDNRRLSLIVVATTRIWDGGVVCYQMNKEYSFNSTQQEYIYMAMSIYEKSTNVRFVSTATCEEEGMSYCDSCATWVDFKHPTRGRDCNSSIGITDEGAQVMNLADRCFEVDDELKTVYGSAMHEIGHAIGMYHEHQHPKRTVGIFWDKIDQSIWSEMTVRDVSVGGPYDVNSVMHYPMAYGFCLPNYCSQETSQTDCVELGTTFCNLNDDNCTDITRAMCNTTATEAIGQRKLLSAGDLATINELYDTAAWPSSETKINM